MSEIHGAVGSYVVNALDGAELDEFEAHLAVCETCRHEVVELAETAGHLGSMVETAPPPALRQSVLSAIQQVRPMPPLGGEEPAPTAHSVPTGPARNDSTDAPVAAVDELAVRRSRRTIRGLTLAVAAAMVIALALGGWVADLRSDRQAQVAEASREQQLLAAPDTKVYTKTLQGATVKFVVSQSRNEALFVGSEVPDPGADRDYQLWTLRGTTPIPDSVFSGGTRLTWLTGGIDSATALAVTVEPRGGSRTGQPTTPVLVSVAL